MDNNANQTQTPPSPLDMKREIIHIFGILLNKLWGYLEGVIGPAVTLIIFESALRETLGAYPFLKNVIVKDAGVNIIMSDPELDSVVWHTLRDGLLAFVNAGLDLLTNLTGGILNNRLAPDVAEFRQKIEVLN